MTGMTGTLELPWLFLNVHLLLDPVGLAFFVSTLGAWTVAAWSARASLPADVGRKGFRRFFLLALTGNLLATVAGDPITFLLGYALVGLCTVPLVAYDRTPGALRSARSYLAYVVVGEGLLLAATIVAWTPSAGAAFPLTVATPGMALLVLVGLGVKTGMPGLHGWMPAAYRSAPAPAAAALAGATIGLGMLGFLRFGLFSEASGIPTAAWVAIGVGGTVFGAVRGLTRSEPEHVLAYSSISQMGVAFTVLGAGTVEPAAASAVALAVTAFVVHHAFAKTSLFLGVGAARSGVSGRLPRPLGVAALALPALALTGVPLSSGALAKSGLAGAVPSVGWMSAFLTSSSVLTTVLVLHLLRVTARVERPLDDPAGADAVLRPWLASVLLVAGGVWIWPAFRPMAHAALELGHMLTALLPLVVGALIWAALLRTGWAERLERAEGLHLAHRLADLVTDRLARSREARPVLRQVPATTRRRLRHLAVRLEAGTEALDDYVGTWTLTGTLFLLVVLTLRVLL